MSAIDDSQSLTTVTKNFVLDGTVCYILIRASGLISLCIFSISAVQGSTVMLEHRFVDIQKKKKKKKIQEIFLSTDLSLSEKIYLLILHSNIFLTLL